MIKEPIRCKLALNDQPIKQVNSFENLGIIASNSQNTYDEVETQVNKAARVSGCLHNTIWKNMSITSTARIYKIAVRSILTTLWIRQRSNEIQKQGDRMPEVVRWSGWRREEQRWQDGKRQTCQRPHTKRNRTPLGRLLNYIVTGHRIKS